MKSIYWGFATLILTLVLVFILALTNTLIIDALRAITSGSVVGAAAFFLNLSQGKPAQRGMFLLFMAVLGAVAGFVAGWIIMSLLYMPLLGGSLIGSAAKSFAFSCGIVGACALLGFALNPAKAKVGGNKKTKAPSAKKAPAAQKTKPAEQQRIEPTLNIDDVTL